MSVADTKLLTALWKEIGFAVAEARLGSILKVNLTSKPLTYTLDRRALQRARLLDDKLILVSHAPDLDAATLAREDVAIRPVE